MADEPIPPPPRPPHGPAPRARVGAAARDVALGAVVFVATLLLLLGASRFAERAGLAPGPTATQEIAERPSTTPGSTAGSSPAPSTSPANDGSAAPTGSPATVQTPAPSGDPVLVGAGDIGHCGSRGDEATATLLDDIPGTVFTAGDNAYESGTTDQFRGCYDVSWGRHRDRTRPAPGTHDWDTADLAGYFDYFGDAAKGPDGSSWYSYDLGTWHVIVLDSMCGKVGGCEAASRQGEWLAGDLAATDARCTVAIFHHPRFSSGEHGDSPGMDAFWRPLYAADVDIIVNGHDHDYERFAPQDPDGRADGARGIREFVVGTGGAPLRTFPGTAPNSELRVSIAHGVLALTLREGTYEWAYIAADSDFRDRGTAPCH